MRIGIFTDRYLPQIDGVSFSTETFRVELEKLGHEVFIFAPRPSWRHKDKSDRIIRFAAVDGLILEDQLISFFFPPQAVRQVEKMNLDIVHFMTPGQIGMLGAYYAIKKQAPLVTTYHTDLFEYVKHYRSVLPGSIAMMMLTPVITGSGMAGYREALSSIKPEKDIDKWNQKLVMRGVTLLHNQCDLVITPSQKIERQQQSWHVSSRIVTLATGVEKITTTKRDVASFRKKYDLAVDDHVIIFVGRIGTEKNIGLLIKSFDTVAHRDSRAKLLIVGHGDDIEDFQAMAAQSPYADRIIFTGRIDRHKLGAVYEIATVLGFPSLTDTQGMAVNEAACAGVPVVMVDKEISEVVALNENGLFAKNNPRDFASKLLQVITNTRMHDRMGKRSLELAAGVSPSKQAAKLLRLYEETIELHRAKPKPSKPSKPSKSAAFKF